jgi:hypothetical protein
MSRGTPRTVLLAQLAIPPLGPAPVRGNVPLAAAYLKLFAERQVARTRPKKVGRCPPSQPV